MFWVSIGYKWINSEQNCLVTNSWNNTKILNIWKLSKLIHFFYFAFYSNCLMERKEKEKNFAWNGSGGVLMAKAKSGSIGNSIFLVVSKFFFAFLVFTERCCAINCAWNIPDVYWSDWMHRRNTNLDRLNGIDGELIYMHTGFLYTDINMLLVSFATTTTWKLFLDQVTTSICGDSPMKELSWKTIEFGDQSNDWLFGNQL